MKLYCFDIDDTLTSSVKPLKKSTIKYLNKLAKSNKVLLISGKPTAYIYGIVRQANLKNIYIAGENGASINIGDLFPPNENTLIKYTKKIESDFKKLKENLIKKYENQIWFQPNEVNLSVFPKDQKGINKLFKYMNKKVPKNCFILKHKDAIDIIPNGINKAEGIKELLKMLKINREDIEIIAFGNASNDIEMLEYADTSYIVGNEININKKVIRFQNMKELNFFLKKLTQ